MLAKTLTLLCLVALVRSIDDLPFAILETLGIHPSNHITVATKSQSAGLPLFNGPHYYIPDGECLGHLDTARLCGDEPLEGIEVRVSDPHDFARVKIHQERRKVRILRGGRPHHGMVLHCPDVAMVDVRLSCGRWKFSHNRHRLRLPGRLGSNGDSFAGGGEEDEAQ